MRAIGANVTFFALRVPHYEHHCQTLGQGWEQTYNVPIKLMPHPPPGKGGDKGGDLNFTNFKCLTCRASQSVKSPPCSYPQDGAGPGDLTRSYQACATSWL